MSLAGRVEENLHCLRTIREEKLRSKPKKRETVTFPHIPEVFSEEGVSRS